MATALAVKAAGLDADALERVLLDGDLQRLTTEQRISYYRAVCESTGLNPLTQPFAYLQLNGKLRLYALKSATDQLRSIHDVSVTSMEDNTIEGVYIVTVQVRNAKGRTDMAKGAVAIKGLAGEAFANAVMKAETKAKRRATLSICGLGMLDETEVDDMPGQRYTPPPASMAPRPPTATVQGTAATAPQPELPLAPPAMIDDPERVVIVARVRRLMIDSRPDGLGWHTKHAEAWLGKYFGVKKPLLLRKPQALDAELLLLARLDAEGKQDMQPYLARLEMMHAEGRILSGEDK